MKRPLVVGYKGEIGRFILAGLLKTMPKALDIFCVDKNESTGEVISRIKKSDVIFLCVPFDRTIWWLVKYAKHLKGKIVVEQTSLKNWAFAMDLKKEFPSVKFMHMHILFRPSETPNVLDRRVVIVGNINKLQDRHFYDTYHVIAQITESQIQLCSSITNHDNMMAVHQTLTHRVVVRLADEIRKLPHKTFISNKIVELADRIIRGGELTKHLQTNPNKYEVVHQFAQNLSTEPLFYKEQ